MCCVCVCVCVRARVGACVCVYNNTTNKFCSKIQKLSWPAELQLPDAYRAELLKLTNKQYHTDVFPESTVILRTNYCTYDNRSVITGQNLMKFHSAYF
jgi:hypothetical protein